MRPADPRHVVEVVDRPGRSMRRPPVDDLLAVTEWLKSSTIRIIGYGRVSDVAGREGDRFHSLADQRDRVKAFVKARGHKLVDWVEDLDESGGTLDRPGLQHVLERLDAGEADALAVAYLSRLTRNTVQGLELVTRLNAAGRDVLVADLDLDTSTPSGEQC